MRKMVATLVVMLMGQVLCASTLGGISDAVRESGIKAGIVVHLGCGDGRETARMLVNDKLLVQGLDTDPRDVAAARKYLSAQGIYGKTTVSHFDGKRLPYADNLVNLVVADAPGDVTEAEVLRVLAPLGSAIIGGKTVAKPWPKAIDEWGHFLHGPDNNAVAKDSVVGMPRNIQWINGPKWQRSHEEFSTVSVAVSSAGRLFYIVDRSPQAYISFNPHWKLVARDAFNGMLLWERDVPAWVDHMRQFRSGPAHLQRRLVAKGDSVYVTLGLDAPLSKLDAATGETLKVYEGTEWTEEVIAEDDSLYLLVGSSETSRFGSGLFDRDEPPMRKERFMVALDEADGNERWRIDGKGENFIMPLGMALSGGKLFYHNVKGLGCVDPQTGTQHWFHERPVVGTRYGFSTSTLVATPEVVLLADKDPAHKQSKDLPVADGDIKWAVGGWDQAPLKGGRTGIGFVTAYATGSGKELWKAPCAEGYNVPVDVLVNDGLVWIGPFHRRVAAKQGVDLKTGQVMKTISTKGDPVGMVHDRCYRNKASSSFIFTCRDGIEVHDYEKGWIRNNSWTRGPCQFGIMPCNGLMYVPTDPCACHLKTRIHGFKAYSSQRLSTVGKPLAVEQRLVKGPAYRTIDATDAEGLSDDWPGYRNDIARSGATSARVTLSETPKWSARLGGTLTQPVVAGGMVYLASREANTIFALDSASGNVKWRYVAGGTIDSSPTVYNGRVLFGCADGRVYCLDARSGQMAWVFTAAPEERQVCIHGQLQSMWPVHGSVIVNNNEVTFTAGRSSFLGGGLYFYRLNAATGEILAQNVISHVNPETEQQLGPKETGFDGVGVVSDLLTSDGESCFLKHLCLNREGQDSPSTVPHLFSPTSLLDEEWFVRSYWTYAPSILGAGYGGWARTANANPAGRILSLQGDVVYGYGRREAKGGRVGHRSNHYVLFAMNKEMGSAATYVDKNGKKRKRPPAKQFIWQQEFPLTVRAMVATADSLIVAGVPNVGSRPKPIDPKQFPERAQEAKQENHRLQFENPEEALDAFRGKQGAFIHVVSPEDGRTLKTVPLESMPVHDGMSAANGKLFITLKNGVVTCYGK